MAVAAAAGATGDARAANLSPRDASAAVVAAAPAADTDVAVVSTGAAGGVKPGLKGLAAPYGPNGDAPPAAAAPKGLCRCKQVGARCGMAWYVCFLWQQQEKCFLRCAHQSMDDAGGSAELVGKASAGTGAAWVG